MDRVLIVASLLALASAQFSSEWKGRSNTVCRTVADAHKVKSKDPEFDPATMCSIFSEVIERSTADYVRATLRYSKNKVTEEGLLATSLSEPYLKAGAKHMRRAAKWLIKNPMGDQDVHEFISEQMMNWYLGVASKRPKLAKKTKDPADYTHVDNRLRVKGQGAPGSGLLTEEQFEAGPADQRAEEDYLAKRKVPLSLEEIVETDVAMEREERRQAKQAQKDRDKARDKAREQAMIDAERRKLEQQRKAATASAQAYQAQMAQDQAAAAAGRPAKTEL